MEPRTVIITAANGKIRTGAFFNPLDIYVTIDRYIQDGYSLEELEIEGIE